MPYTDFGPSSLGATGGSPDDAAKLIAIAILTDVCNIWRKGPGTSDGQGTKTRDYGSSPYLSDVACRLRLPRSEREVNEDSALTALTTWFLDLPRGTDLRSTDRVEKSGRFYEVTDDSAGETATYLLTAVVIRVNRAAS